MRDKMNRKSLATFSSLRARTTFALLLAVCLAAPVHAAELRYLSKRKPDPISLLAPPPLPNSAEQAADLASVVAVNKTATSNDIASANSERKIYVFNFAPVIGIFFQSNSLPKTTAFFQQLHYDIQDVVDAGKDYWKRPRPFVVEPRLASGELETSFSYPSGHSTKATVYAAVLAEIFPDKRQNLFAAGRQLGWHRVQIARHYPTDIHAGHVLGQAIMCELEKSSRFRRDLAEVKKEIATAHNAKKD
jgi:acid phosphatase (class A)